MMPAESALKTMRNSTVCPGRTPSPTLTENFYRVASKRGSSRSDPTAASTILCHEAKMTHEKSRLFNEEDRMHNTHTIRSGMVPGVQKVGVVHSIDQGPEKSESEGAFYDTLCG